MGGTTTAPQPVTTPTTGPINTTQEGTQIGEIQTPGLLALYVKDLTTVPTTTVQPTTTVIDMPNPFTGMPTIEPTTIVTTQPTTVIDYSAPQTVTPTASAPTTSPCGVNLQSSTLTVADVKAMYPGFKWDPSKNWTPQEMECWAYLALQSGLAHPDRTFSQDYGFEPYLLI